MSTSTTAEEKLTIPNLSSLPSEELPKLDSPEVKGSYIDSNPRLAEVRSTPNPYLVPLVYAAVGGGALAIIGVVVVILRRFNPFGKELD